MAPCPPTTSNEGEIRKSIIEADLVDCIVALPGQLFRSTQIPACLWFLSRGRSNREHRDRQGETLFIDARKLGHLVDRANRDLSAEEIARVANTYHAWRGKEGLDAYADIPRLLQERRPRGDPQAWPCPDPRPLRRRRTASRRRRPLCARRWRS